MTPQFEQKICAPQDLGRRAAALPKKLVFTNGVFDILHRGHVTYLAQARSLGASLVVLLNSDVSVKRLGKGADRPINTQADRMAVIAAVACVDLVSVFDEDTPYNQIIAAHPDILVKGGDWAVDKIVGGTDVIAWGGEVRSIAFEHERSTTAMLQKIRISP